MDSLTSDFDFSELSRAYSEHTSCHWQTIRNPPVVCRLIGTQATPLLAAPKMSSFLSGLLRRSILPSNGISFIRGSAAPGKTKEKKPTTPKGGKKSSETTGKEQIILDALKPRIDEPAKPTAEELKQRGRIFCYVVVLRE